MGATQARGRGHHAAAPQPHESGGQQPIEPTSPERGLQWREWQQKRPPTVTVPVVSLVLPAHNEQDRLAATLREYSRALQRRYGSAYELIVACNGCVDGTVPVALDTAAVLPQIRVLDTQTAAGKGGAVLEGMRRARAERVAFADADGATGSDSLIALFDALDCADVAIGSRRLPGSVIARSQPPVRRALGFAFGVSVRLLFGMPYRDTQCGAKAFRQPAARQLAQVVRENRWTFDVDLLLAASTMRLQVSEHPVVWADQPGSRLRILPTVCEIVPALWRMWRRWAAGAGWVPESTTATAAMVSAAVASRT